MENQSDNKQHINSEQDNHLPLSNKQTTATDFFDTWMHTGCTFGDTSPRYLLTTYYLIGIALDSNGRVYTWLHNKPSQLGRDIITNHRSPVRVKGLTDITAVAAGAFHSLALTRNGHVYTWRCDNYGPLEDGTTVDRASPVRVKGLTDITAVAAGAFHSLALTRNGHVYAWGSSDFGQVGDGTTGTYRREPIRVEGLTNVTAITASHDCSLALTRNGLVYAWGCNDCGQLGDGTTVDRANPVRVEEVTDVAAIAAGLFHSVALTREGRVYAWGDNRSGQVGKGTATLHCNPVWLGELTGVTAITADSNHTVVLTREGLVYAWGQVGIPVRKRVFPSTSDSKYTWNIRVGMLRKFFLRPVRLPSPTRIT